MNRALNPAHAIMDATTMTTSGKHKLARMGVQICTLATIVLMVAAYRVAAHDWYPTACCGGGPAGDCDVIAASRVKTNALGYTVDGKHFKSHSETQQSPDGSFHACFPKILKGGIGCFFAPPPNS